MKKAKSHSAISHPLFADFIEAYQRSLRDRYSREKLFKYEFAKSIPEKDVEALVQFFQESLYPSYPERLKLDAAFDALSGFVKNPSKIWGILGNLTLSIFRFGKHFPQALKAGLSALHSYITAHEFEEELLVALEKEEDPKSLLDMPEGIPYLLSKISQAKADAFRADLLSLFRAFSDPQLIDKIILILKDVLEKMDTKPQLYTSEDKSGIQLGLSILKKGQLLFAEKSKEERERFLPAIDQVERDYFTEAKEKYQKKI